MGLNMFDLRGRVALVTGSSQGIGLELARGLGAAGATVVLNGRTEEKLQAACEQLRGHGITVHSLCLDVSDEEALAALIPELEKTVGPLDILVNNAGIQIRGLLEQLDSSVWRRVLEGNLTSAFLVTRYVVRPMIARRRGKIINICSLMSELGRQSTGPYTAAKGGLKMLTRAMAVEWARHNIQINGIGPGYFLTEMTRSLADDPEFDGWLKKRTPAGRWGLPEELVGTAVYLASSASDFVNGQIIYVDGGILASL
ncbi:MAG: SDR family oxidoreductase [Desulfofustis sp.]|nr:SDR family oxidoreductase [Desulfofustis sp.]